MRLVFSDFKERSIMSSFARASCAASVIFALGLLSVQSAGALDLDWHGQFRAEDTTLFGYSHGVPAGTNDGYTIPFNGDSPATFQDLFFRLTPRVLVNDNVSLHSDIWFGTPDEGAFGFNGSGGTYHSTNAGNATVTAHTLYSEVATDFGTMRVGRVPLNWGLGLIWNAKESGFDRLPSNGDAFSLVTKLGAFKFMPAIVKYQKTGTAGVGNGGMNDYTVALTYNNDDEQVDLGIMFMHRIAGNSVDVVNPFSVTTVTKAGFAYNVWDFYARKKAGAFTFTGEVPVVSGQIDGHNYSTISGVVRTDIQATEKWALKLDLGSASGQDNGTAGTPADKFTAFSFHPDYRPGFLMFNYNYRNISTGSGSPYNNPVTNARFLAFNAEYTTGKWSHGFGTVFAQADKVADGVAGNVYFNNADGIYQVENGSPAQEKNMGLEIDYAMGYDWDESIRFGLDLGLYFPGKFYDFNNRATPNVHKTVFGTGLNMLVKF